MFSTNYVLDGIASEQQHGKPKLSLCMFKLEFGWANTAKVGRAYCWITIVPKNWAFGLVAMQHGIKAKFPWGRPTLLGSVETITGALIYIVGPLCFRINEQQT